MKQPSHRLVPTEKAPHPLDPRVDVGHVHLKTADLKRVYEFYVGLLGFDVVLRLPTALFLSVGGYHHDLAFNTWESAGGSPPPATATGLYHVALRFPDRKSLSQVVNRLIDAGWPLDGGNHHGTHEAVYLHDPDENGLELYYDLPESEWPLDKDGHLDFRLPHPPFDLESLLAAK